MSDFSSDGQSAYFTQSRELLNSVEHKYKNIDGHKENINPQFLNINEFCRSVLEDGAWARKNFVETTQFLNEFVANDKDVQHVLAKYSLTPIDLWTEIRGVIKGSTKPDWTRTELFDQRNFEGRDALAFRELNEKGFFKRNASDKRLFELNPEYKSLDYDDLPDYVTD